MSSTLYIDRVCTYILNSLQAENAMSTTGRIYIFTIN
jgi:hypothetical protein